jgi:hypothetical protein
MPHLLVPLHRTLPPSPAPAYFCRQNCAQILRSAFASSCTAQPPRGCAASRAQLLAMTDNQPAETSTAATSIASHAQSERPADADTLASLLETLAALSVNAAPPLAGASRREKLAQLDALLASLVSANTTAAVGDVLDWDALLRTLPSLAPDSARRLLPALTAIGPPASALPRLHAAAISALSHRGNDSWLRAAASALRACGAAVMRTQGPDSGASSSAKTASGAPASRLDASTIAALLDTALAALVRGGAATIAAAPAPQSAVQAERMGFQGGALTFGRRGPTRSGGPSEAAAGVAAPRSQSRLGCSPTLPASPSKPRARQATDDEAGWTSAASQSGTDDHDPQR